MSESLCERFGSSVARGPVRTNPQQIPGSHNERMNVIVSHRLRKRLAKWADSNLSGKNTMHVHWKDNVFRSISRMLLLQFDLATCRFGRIGWSFWFQRFSEHCSRGPRTNATASTSKKICQNDWFSFSKQISSKIEMLPDNAIDHQCWRKLNQGQPPNLFTVRFDDQKKTARPCKKCDRGEIHDTDNGPLRFGIHLQCN